MLDFLKPVTALLLSPILFLHNATSPYEARMTFGYIRMHWTMQAKLLRSEWLMVTLFAIAGVIVWLALDSLTSM